MYKLKLLWVLFLFSAYCSAQNFLIKGKVIDAKGTALSGVNISVVNEPSGTQTANDGTFEIQRKNSKNMTLVFSFIGYQTQKLPVSINGEITDLKTITLKKETQNINEIQVVKDKTNSFSKEKSDYVAKIPLDNLENPQVYTSVSSDLLKEQLVTNFDDALKNVSGMIKLWESTGRGSDGAGYYSLRGFSVQPTLLNGLPSLTNGSLDPADIESIEVMKGPSGTLYGSSLISYGGLINVVTKKPLQGKRAEFSYLTGSYGLNRLTADINTPIDSTGKYLFRLNTAFHTENSFQDAGFKKSFFLAPSLRINASDKLSFLFVTEIYNPEQTNQTMLFLNRSNPLTYTDIDDVPYDYNRSYTSDNLSIKNPTFSLQGQMNYKISSSWNSQTAISRSIAKSKGYYSYLYEYTSSFADITKGMVFYRYVSDLNTTTDVTDIQQNFVGDFKLGTIRNRVVAGADYMQINSLSNSTGYVTNGLVYMGSDDAQTVYDAVYGGEEVSNYDSGVLSKEGMDALLANSSVSSSTSIDKTFGAYISDVINFTPALSVMASVRYDHFEGDPDDDTDNQDAISPKFGLTYQPILNKVTIFANYMNGFSNVSAQTVYDADGNNGHLKYFDPEHANQMEIGVKTNIWKDKIAATASYYDITVKNKTMTDPDNSNNVIQAGEVESNGFGLDLIANPVKGLNAVIGYSHNHNEIVKAASNVGKRSLSAGPEDLFNAWLSYKFTNESPLNGLGLGLGANYLGKNTIINYEATGDFILPAYTIYNASLFWEQSKFRLALKLDNLANEKYFIGWSTLNPQKTRAISCNFIFKI